MVRTVPCHLRAGARKLRAGEGKTRQRVYPAKTALRALERIYSGDRMRDGIWDIRDWLQRAGFYLRRLLDGKTSAVCRERDTF